MRGETDTPPVCRWMLVCDVVLAGALCAACAAPPGHRPIARFSITPAYVCLDDNFATQVTLDGSASGDVFDAGAAVTYEWRFAGDEYRAVVGDTTRQALVATFAGRAPVRVSLTVTDLDDRQSVHEAVVGLALPGAEGCPPTL